ncbi:hypothetical protein [Mycobacterium sp.]|uniref:hypothetical protein n=1 Tax=Mycobacterium sp. TaxID=1785 RepID=UPI003F96A1B0
MTVCDTTSDSVSEIVDSPELTALFRQLPLEPRCRVCRNDALRGKVNGLLAIRTSYAMILRAIENDNTRLDKRDRITIDSVRNHTARHFPVQNVAKATYREILERRANENGIDFVNGVATAITPMAFYESVMVKGYESLVDPDTKVDVNTGMVAAGRLQALIESRASGTRMVDMWAQMNRIIEVVQSMVPQELHEELLQRIEWQGPVAVHTPADEFEGAEDEYGPVESAQADQDCWTQCARRD